MRLRRRTAPSPDAPAIPVPQPRLPDPGRTDGRVLSRLAALEAENRILNAEARDLAAGVIALQSMASGKPLDAAQRIAATRAIRLAARFGAPS